MRNRRARALWLSAAVLGATATVSSSSWAWKPYTHVYLAQQAWQDAVDDGQVTIYQVDAGGQIRRDTATGRPLTHGTYPVEPRVLRALRNSPAKFFAGVLGPDAYPDILTGQMRIHPPGPSDDHADVNRDGPGTDAWMQQLWVRAWQQGSDDAIAFATGFLAHAAGDIYAHTFMNTFAGGIFDLQDMSNLNWFKHITVEGYVGERTPDLAMISPPGKKAASLYNIVRDDGVTGLEGLIAENTWTIRSANGLTVFPTEGNTKFSVPWHLGTFLEDVTAANSQVRAYDAGVWSDFSHAAYNASPVATARELAWACGSNSCPEDGYSASDCPAEYPRGAGVCAGFVAGGIGVWASGWATLMAAYGTAYATEHPIAAAVEGWTSNAMATTPVAMRDWVSASHNTAIHLFFTPDHLMHMDGDEFPANTTLGDGYTPFKIDLESIATGLDRGTVQFINDVIEFIMMPLTDLKAAIGDAEKWVIDEVFKATFHMTVDQAKQCFAKPHMWLNPLLRNNTKGLGATLQSLNAIMRLPPITPATCAGSTAQCTIAPSLVGADVTGACDIMAGGSIAKFTVRPEDPQGVFPAAFNTVNMIKLSMMDPTALGSFASGLSKRTLTLGSRLGCGAAPPNAMLGFAATIDGSNQWVAERNGIGWGYEPMILARDCPSYWSVFLDQRPNFDASLRRTAADPLLLPVSDRQWEPDAFPVCGTPTGIAPMPSRPTDITVQQMADASKSGASSSLKSAIGTNATNPAGGVGAAANSTGPVRLTTTEPATFALASAGKGSSLTRGSLAVAADGRSATYVPPKWSPTGVDLVRVTSKDGTRSKIVPIRVDIPSVAAYRREVPKRSAPGGGVDPTGLRAGETAQLVSNSGQPITWTIVSGPGTVGDAKLEATHNAALTQQKGSLAASDRLLNAQAPKLRDRACTGPCRALAIDGARKATRARTTAVIGAAAAKSALDTARATYHAPATVTKDETVTLRGVTPGGAATIVRLRLLAPPRALTPKLAATSVQAGKNLRLDVDAGLPAGKEGAPPIPMTWAVVSGPGTVGDPSNKERATHAARKQAFIAGLQPLSKRLAEARPFEVAEARKAWLDYVQNSVPTYAPSFARLDELDRTYHAPANLTGKQRVTVRGTAQDGSGRTVNLTFDVQP